MSLMGGDSIVCSGGIFHENGLLVRRWLPFSVKKEYEVRIMMILIVIIIIIVLS